MSENMKVMPLMIEMRMATAIVAVALLAGCSHSSVRDYDESILPVENAETQISAAGGSLRITLGATPNYTASVDRDWCRVSTSAATITLTVTPNRSVSGRSALLTVKAGERFRHIPVTRKGAALTLGAYEWNPSPKGDSTRIAYKSYFPLKISIKLL